jgi:hypothetical protein
MLLKETFKNRTSSHSQPRGSNGGSSGLSNLFTADDLYTLEEEVVQTKKAGRTSSMRESDYKLPGSGSYQESYTYGSSFGYGNSFYQSYGESFHPSVEEKLLEAPIRQNSLNSIKSAGNSTSKPFFTVKELISLIIRDATVQHTSGNSQADRKLVLDGEVDLLTKIDSLILVPAEEDGSPMDDLPSCPNHTDIFNLGVRDFLIMDRQTEVELIHIRIEGDISPNKPFDGSLAKNLHVVTDEGMYPLSLVREASNGTDFTNDEDFYTLQDDEDDEDADLIQAFRTDTDELLYHELQKVQDELKKKAEPTHHHKKTKDSHQETTSTNPNNRNSVNASRLRSSSGNLMISYRRPGSERWRVAQKLAVLPENSSLEGTPPSLSSTPKFTVPLPPANTTPNSSKKEVSAPIIIGRKEEVANEVRKQLEQKTGGVMPETSKLKQMLLNYNNSQKNLHNNSNNNDLLPRRHSDRPYNEEIDGENSDNNSITYKYSRRYSTTSSDGNNNHTTSSRSCTYTDLNPHTSLSLLSAQLSPAHSTLGENDRKDSGSDDDQLGLIKFDRRKGSMGLLSTKSNGSMDQTRSPSLTPSSLSGRSFAKDEARLPSSFFFPNLDGVSTPTPVSTPNNKVTPRLTNQKVSRNHLLRDSLKPEGEGEEHQQQFPEEEVIKVKTYDQEDDDEEDEGWGEGSHNVDEQILKLQQQLALTGSPATIARKKSLLQPKYPTHLYDINYEENGTGGENGCGRSSENGSVKSGTSTRSGSVLSRLYDYFSSKKRPSLASESNDSVNSSSNPHLHSNNNGSRRSSLQSRPSLYGAPPPAHPVIYEKQLQISKELPIIQNLDTGDVYTLGALKYSAKSLPETVSPESLFGTTPSATTVTTTTAEDMEKIDENGEELI